MLAPLGFGRLRSGILILFTLVWIVGIRTGGLFMEAFLIEAVPIKAVLIEAVLMDTFVIETIFART